MFENLFANPTLLYQKAFAAATSNQPNIGRSTIVLDIGSDGKGVQALRDLGITIHSCTKKKWLGDKPSFVHPDYKSINREYNLILCLYWDEMSAELNEVNLLDFLSKDGIVILRGADNSKLAEALNNSKNNYVATLVDEYELVFMRRGVKKKKEEEVATVKKVKQESVLDMQFMVQPSLQYGIGYEEGTICYVHKEFERVLPLRYLDDAKRNLPHGFMYDIVGFDKQTYSFLFIQVDTFRASDSPVATTTYKVKDEQCDVIDFKKVFYEKRALTIP